MFIPDQHSVFWHSSHLTERRLVKHLLVAGADDTHVLSQLTTPLHCNITPRHLTLDYEALTIIQVAPIIVVSEARTIFFLFASSLNGLVS